MAREFNTPILLLIFNRPDVTQLVFNKIREIQPAFLYVAADGPRPEKFEDQVNCKLTREIINHIDWPCNLKTLFREENLGCGYGVCSAISWFFKDVDNGIILEDDCLPDPSFFYFCDELLNKYNDVEDIYLISGMNRHGKKKWGNGSYYFSYYPITWGWATWRRAWDKFNYDIPDIDLSFNAGLLNHVFQSHSEKKYWWRKIKSVELHKKNIWDYQWRFSVWKHKGCGITPNTNLVKNIGTNNSPTHEFLKDSVREPEEINPIAFPLDHPIKKIEHEADKYLFINSYSHSLRRALRIIKENGILTVTRFLLKKILLRT